MKIMQYHSPVLLKETVEGLNIKPDGVYVDVTFGGGGHSRAILEKLGPKGKLIAFDQDEDAKANIPKEVCVHTLRHTFATHLLEDGLDILTIKNLLGHEDIETTMTYLQIAQLQNQKTFSPLDTLFEQCSQSMK